MGKILMIFLISLGIIFTSIYSVEADNNNDEELKSLDISKVIEGAVEDNSWMQAKSKTELSSTLEKYFVGDLLEHTVDQCWYFVNLNSDWYGKMHLLDISIVNINLDLDEATVVAYINEVDANNMANTTLYMTFVLQLTPDGWRIKQNSFLE